MPQIALKNIVIDGSTQFRVEPIEADYVKVLSEAYKDPQHSIPPVKLFSDGSKFFVGDGHARIAARRLLGADSVDAVVKDGGKRAAIHYAIGANEENGARRSNPTRRKCVEFAISNPEHKDKSDRIIADICRVSGTFVGDVRKSMSAGESTVERTKRVGRDGKHYPPNKPSDADENPASVICKRCKRVGPVANCNECKRLREAAGSRAKRQASKSGKVVYDWRTADAAMGPVMREPDVLTKAYGKYADWPTILKTYVEPMAKLLDELSNLRRDTRKALLKIKES